tara:strand:+ start:47 stop:238 length:192 start_codon:yes stop_codon:yes gene_type:complete
MDKNRLSPWEAKRNLREMKEIIDDDHLFEVEEKIFQALDSENCENCEESLCDCNWEIYKWANF